MPWFETNEKPRHKVSTALRKNGIKINCEIIHDRKYGWWLYPLEKVPYSGIFLGGDLQWALATIKNMNRNVKCMNFNGDTTGLLELLEEIKNTDS